MDFQEGEILYINKPYRMTSFGALAYVRTRLSKKLHVKRLKTGHAGTLDPLATGVLILCTGKATKKIESLQYATKEYTAVRTPELAHRRIGMFPKRERIARKHEGVVSVMAVQAGRDLRIVVDPEKMQMSIRVVCGKGTYIRALARDIGEALGSGAFLTALCRTRLGDVRIEDCMTLDAFSAWLDGI